MKKISKKILFMGKYDDKYSKIMINNLKKKFKHVSFFFSKHNKDIPNQKILNWKGDIIICFRSHFILSQKFIKKAKICAINFHPGPPQYRGIGCVNFALENSEKYYGATAHLISKKIDFGKILDCKLFKISKKDTISKVLEKTYKIQIKQLDNLISELIKKNYDYKSFFKKNSWSSKLYLRKDLEKLYIINKNIKKSKLNIRIRATYINKFKPYILLHGYKFVLEI